MLPSFIYIDFVKIDHLDDQITHAKAFSPHHYEQQILMEERMTQSCQTCTTLPIATICWGSFKSGITTW